MPPHISQELSATTLKWFALAAVQLTICAIFDGASSDGTAWYFAEPPLAVLLILAGHGSPEAIGAALHPPSSARLLIELVVLPGAVRALSATRALRRIRVQAATA
jgi:hypothetical protein